MEYIYIGKILNTFALKGEVKVSIDTDFVDERYKKGSKVYLKLKDEYLPLGVENYRFYKNSLLLKFKDYDDINDIEKYKGLEIYKSKDDIEALEDGFYYSDLVGLSIYDKDTKKGVVINVEDGVAYNFLRVKTEKGEALVPFIDKFIEEVDLKTKRIYIKMIEGLL